MRMKKIRMTIMSLVAVLFASVAFGQAVSDNAVIPVGVTLNPVLRINVVEGGNIQFVLSTLDDYKLGVSNDYTAQGEFHDTRFEVASSVDYTVTMTPESELTGVDHGSTINMSYLGYHIEELGAYNTTSYLSLEPSGVETVQEIAAGVTIIQPNAAGYNSNAGDADDNEFWLHWEFATSSLVSSAFVAPAWSNAFIRQNYVPDYYISNIILELAPVVAW